MYTRVDIIGASASTAFYSKLVMSLKVIRTLTKKYGHIGVIFLREGIGREIGGHIYIVDWWNAAPSGLPCSTPNVLNRRGDILILIREVA